jgi:hypothetical protein
MARGAVVVILSDGWDRGDPDELAEQMATSATGRPPGDLGQPAQGHARLRPARPGHGRGAAPRRRFVEGHSLAAMEELTRVIAANEEGTMIEICSTTSTGGDAPGKHRGGARGRHRGIRPPRPGAAMAVNDDGEVAGSVSGGCVEGAVVAEALSILSERRARHRHLRLLRRRSLRRRPHLRRHHPPLHRGTRLVTETTPPSTPGAVAASGTPSDFAERPVALATVIDGPHVGSKLLVEPGDPLSVHSAPRPRSGGRTRRARRARAAGTGVRHYGPRARPHPRT